MKSALMMKTRMFAKSKLLITSLVLLVLGSANVQARAGKQMPSMSESDISIIALGVMLFVAIVVLIVCLYVLRVLSIELGKVALTSGRASEGFWTKLNKKFVTGDLLPVDREEEIMMDHAYDGISELNNHMPPWLKNLFYLTIGVAVIYTFHFLILKTGKSQLQEYAEEMAVAEKLIAQNKTTEESSVDENSVVLVTDAQVLEKAKTVYVQNCAPCHGKDGGGSVGPNLTDDYWLHGGNVQDVFKVIKYGVQEKGMIPWKDKLKPEMIQDVAGYILSLRGTTPEKPKEPQGEKYVDADADNKAVSSLK